MTHMGFLSLRADVLRLEVQGSYFRPAKLAAGFFILSAR